MTKTVFKDYLSRLEVYHLLFLNSSLPWQVLLLELADTRGWGFEYV